MALIGLFRCLCIKLQRHLFLIGPPRPREGMPGRAGPTGQGPNEAPALAVTARETAWTFSFSPCPSIGRPYPFSLSPEAYAFLALRTNDRGNFRALYSE